MPARARVTAEVLRRRIAGRCDALERDLDRAASGMAARPVHELRVAARGLRSVLGTLRPLLRTAPLRRARRDLRNLALEFAAVRAADVRRDWLGALGSGRAALPPGAQLQLLALLDEARAEARSELGGHLRSLAFRERRHRLLQALRDPRLVAARGDLGVATARLLRRRWRRLDAALKRGRREADAAALHAARLAAKHARYASESLMPMLGLDPAPAAGQLKRLQDCLGEYRDAAEALDWLESLGEPRGPVLRAGLEGPAGQVMKRRLKQFRRLAAGFAMPDFGPPRRVAAVSRARRRPAARSARS